MKIDVREERPGDGEAIRALHLIAFGQSEEADIVDALRRNGGVRLSLVATVDGDLVGHILYSPINIGGRCEGVALGPMAVHPDRQGAGVGAALVAAGNARLANDGCPCVVVLGHAAYYPRFGFAPAAARGVTCQWPVPDDVFMLLVLDESKMRGVLGRAEYRPEFSTTA